MRLPLRLIAIALAVVIGVPVVIGTIVVVHRAMTKPAKHAALPRVAPFGRVGFTVDGGHRVHCALLADSDEAQLEGMQGMHNLLGYDAMVFRFPAPTAVAFINHFVPIDLSIGWYDAAGRLVDHTTMAACPAGTNCPTYASKDPFAYAVETPVGGLAGLGLTHAGAVIHVGGGCPA